MLTAIQYITNIQRELNKVSASSFHLDDFVYFVNKGTQEYINNAYRLFEVSQQLSDDVSVLKVRRLYAITDVTVNSYINSPTDYLHLTGIKVTLVDRSNNCFLNGEILVKPAKRKTTDMDGFLIDNHFGKANKNRIFYQEIGNLFYIEAGQDVNTGITLNSIEFNYLKKPPVMNLLEADYDNFITTGIDVSQISVFPDYVDAEIIKEVVKLFLENQGNERLSTNIPVNQSIR